MDIPLDRHSFSRLRFVAAVVALFLCLPFLQYSAAATEEDIFDAAPHAHVLRRLNSPERAAAIERIKTAEQARQQETARNLAPLHAPESPRVTLQTQHGAAPKGTVFPSQANATVPQSSLSVTDRPKTAYQAIFDEVAGFMGVPGLQSVAGSPEADQGLGFHPDGTARRADGRTGGNEASNGRRVAAYARAGLEQPDGTTADMAGYYGVGYDQATQHNFRINPLRGGLRAESSSGLGMLGAESLMESLTQRGLSYGAGLANSAGEAAFMGLTGKGQARFNFQLDMDGRVNGEGDALYPFHDGQYTTVFGQAGLRTMSGMSDDWKGRGGDRWIGNIGLGQRWYPFASMGEDGETVDSGNWMFGYNIFYDHDFTRSHRRGGAGLEAQYDWLALAANYYTPLSSWRSSYDFDSRYVEERPAKGWDIRGKGYLPFYRNIAVTGAYTRWYGDAVSMYGSRDLEKDPKVWSYGVEYTPVPLISGFLNQRSSERGNAETELGMRFTYRFNMPWDQQVSHRKVQEMRNVGASRHEFVNREHRIILEYREKNVIELLWLNKSTAQFSLNVPTELLFQVLRNGKPLVNHAVTFVSPNGFIIAATQKTDSGFFAQAADAVAGFFGMRPAHAASSSLSKQTDSNGEVTFTLTPLAAGTSTQTVSIMGQSLPVEVKVDSAPLPEVLTLTPTITDYAFNAPTSATFTLLVDGQPLANTGMHLNWSGTGVFSNAPPTAVTDSNGRFTISNLTGSTVGGVTLTATLDDGRVVSCTLNIGHGALLLEPVPFSYTAGVATSGDFTLTENGAAVANTPLTLTWIDTQGSFELQPAAATTDGSGKFTFMGLKGVTPGPVTLTALLPDGRTASCTVVISSGVLRLQEITTSVFDLGALEQSAVFELRNNGALVLNEPVTLVWTSTNGGSFITQAISVTTNGSGQFTLNLAGQSVGRVLLQAQVFGATSNAAALYVSVPKITITDHPNIANIVSDGFGTSLLKAKVINAAGNPMQNVTVTWSVDAAANNAPAVKSTWKSRRTGLFWATSPTATSITALDVDIPTATSVTNASGVAAKTLLDIMGTRVLTVRASATIYGRTYVSPPQTVTVGDGSLAVFRSAPTGLVTWQQAYQTCNGSAYAGDPAQWTLGLPVGGSKMPTVAHLRGVAFRTSGAPTLPFGAAYAAGWPHNKTWAREAGGPNKAQAVNLGADSYDPDVIDGTVTHPAACLQ